MNASLRAAIVVVGEGIVGAAVAHHLTRLGAVDILLVEAERLAEFRETMAQVKEEMRGET